MSETRVVFQARSGDADSLPQLDPAQEQVVRAAATGSVIVRGAPGSGRTTSALAVFGQAISRGENAMIWVPDRTRADAIEPVAQALAPTAVRPVRTPAAFAYLVVSTWRIGRADPLGSLELVTGAAEDSLIADLLDHDTVEWPPSIPPQMRSMPAFRMEMRNLFARAGEAGIDGPGLQRWGRELGRPEWEVAGQILEHYESGEGFDLSSRESMLADTSHIQGIAARVLDRWHEDAPKFAVSAAAPVPDVVIVDDLQDCTASTVDMLAVLAALGTRIVALADPDVAVASFRGGEPHLDRRLALALGPEARDLELGGVHRGTPALRALVAEVTSRITQSGPVGRRSVGVAIDEGGADQLPDEGQEGRNFITAHVAASEAQLGALMARHLRTHHLHHGVPWRDQVVLVRSSGEVGAVRRHLKRGGVPVSGRRRAFAFAQEPVTRVLLDLVASSLDEAGADKGRQVAERIIDSPLVAIDPLDVHRLLRTLNSTVVAPGDAEGSEGEAEEGDVDVVALSVDVVDLLERPDLAYGQVNDNVVEEIERASRVWKAREGAWRARPGQALWQLWSAADIANRWRAAAMEGGGDSEWFDDQLDAVLALFRVADVWEQRTPQGAAMDFASQLLGDQVPTDTIARTGVRPEGVEVLTPAQAMGRQWSVVCLVGVQDGRWPNTRLRDRVLRADLLADAAAGRLGQDEAGAFISDLSAKVARKAVLDDELRLLASAVSRSTRHLHAGAVRTENAAPSSFMDLIARHAQARIEDGQVLTERVPPALDLVGQVGHLRHVAAGVEDTAERELATTLLAVMAREGIVSADPSRWTGVGGLSSTAPISAGGTVRVSPSTVEAARQCVLKWFLTGVGGAPGAGRSQQLGTLIHAIAEKNPHGTQEELLAELQRVWDQLGHDESTWAGAFAHEHARDVVRALAAYIEGVPGHVATEQRIRVQVGDVLITGSIDRVESVDGAVRVTDLKTGATATSIQAAEDHPQLATYQLGLIESGCDVVGAQLVFLGSGKAVVRSQSTLDGQRLDEWRAQVGALGQVMRGPTFGATPSTDACRFCPFTIVCPAKDEGGRTLS